MYTNPRWNTEFAGILAEDKQVSTGKSNIFVNSNSDLQFFIKIISVQPEDFPRQIREVGCFGEELKNWGFSDDPTLSREERKYALQEFLERYILFFTIEKKKKVDGEEYYNARNLSVIRKSSELKENTIFETIPVFSEKMSERSRENFEQQLASKKYVGKNKQLSKGKDDTPSMILWKDGVENPTFTIYGPFEKHDFSYNGGFRFFSSTPYVKKLIIDDSMILDSYMRDDVLFISSNDSTTIQEMLNDFGDIINIENNEEDESNTEKQTEELKDKETKFMEVFKSICRANHMYYEDKDLYNFHIAMKTKGLVILAGMSGIGKSKLVKCYSEALRLLDENSVFIPVRPFWQDDADVIGYVDTINQIYRPGDAKLINTLVNASREGAEELHIVCFDEMNLARVEHYFSQFLSVLESEDSTPMLQLYNNEYESKIHNSHTFPSQVPIGSNVKFVGTVNLDESTYHFSDKVLDRANVITLNMKSYAEIAKMEEERFQQIKDDENINNTKVNNNDSKGNAITLEIYESFKKKDRGISLLEEESKLLWALHLKMQECNKNLGIGWRIIKQINNFLINIPNFSPLTREEAFDLQLVQRVITKIRGSEEQFLELIGSYNPETKEVENSQFLDAISGMPDEYQFIECRKIITTKAKELHLHGHTI